MKHIEYLKSLDACNDAIEWAQTQPDLETAWNNCKRSDWMLWLDENADLFNDRDRRLMACAFVRRTPVGDGRMVWDLLTDERSRTAVEVSERYAVGEATKEELYAAWDAAWDAVVSAARSVVGSAAASAAVSAARSVAGSAAASAARSVAASAARSVAGSAARSAQSDIIREFGNPFNKNTKRDT